MLPRARPALNRCTHDETFSMTRVFTLAGLLPIEIELLWSYAPRTILISMCGRIGACAGELARPRFSAGSRALKFETWALQEQNRVSHQLACFMIGCVWAARGAEERPYLIQLVTIYIMAAK
jgi:hypothetical protein